MLSKALNRSVLLYVFVAIIDLTQSHPMESSEYNSLSGSSESSELIPTLSLKVLPRSSESTYEVSAPLCRTKIKKINPNDLARERGLEVIDDPRFKQIIEVELCENSGASCNNFLYMKSQCRQRIMGIKLRVHTSDKEDKMEEFLIPSVCECVLLSRNNRDLSN